MCLHRPSFILLSTSSNRTKFVFVHLLTDFHDGILGYLLKSPLRSCGTSSVCAIQQPRSSATGIYSNYRQIGSCAYNMSDQSRNSWIKKDDPKLVSSKHKDVFEDMLEDRRHTGDLHFCTRARQIPEFRNNKTRSPGEIKQYVIRSDRVKYAVEKVADERKLPEKVVYKEAQAILDEMSHELSLTAVRSFAFFIVKVMKKLFRRIYVNEDGIQKIRSMIKEYPVLIVPTHRSYLDFLLVSYVFYNYDLPLPVIAAAMDFMGMKFFGWLLRHSGAFYIRRTFGDDQLYWAVFTEYVQTQICNGDYPISFYVEGTRSRTSKSYYPRVGMLSASLEPYFKAHIPDIMIIPISISYDRILEESLYSYELLGIPKPKESTSGLFKARKVLEEDFGNVHIYIDEPLSIRLYSIGKVDRSVHSLAPRYIASLTNQENSLIQSLAHQLVLNHQKLMVIYPWSLIAAVLVQNKDGIHIKQLIKEVEWLKRQASNLGAYIDWPGHESAELIVRAAVQLHPNIAHINSEDVVELLHPTGNLSKGQDELLHIAAQHMMLAMYRNHLLHVFIRVAMITLSINACVQDTMTLDELFNKYTFLENILSRDFVFLPGKTKQDFDHALLVLTHTCGVTMQDNLVQIKKSTNKYTLFFSQMFEPFLLGYWILCRHLMTLTCRSHGKAIARPPKSIVKESQALSAKLLQEGAVKHHDVLSLDLLNNGLLALYQMKIVSKEKRDDSTYMFPNAIALTNTTEQLSKFIDVPNLPEASIMLETKTVVINAKL